LLRAASSPHSRQVTRQRANLRAVFHAQVHNTPPPCIFSLSFKLVQLLQPLLPFPLERPSNHAIIRVDCFVAPFRLSRFVPGLFNAEPPMFIKRFRLFSDFSLNS
jgi:hypothetical protein